MVNLGVLLLEAVRIGLYMRLMKLCIGGYRGSRRLTAAAFFGLWAAEGFLRSLSPGEREIMPADLFFFMAEIPVLFLLSFCYKGGFWGHVGMAFFLPAFSWMGRWTFLSLFSGKNISFARRYVWAAAITILLLGLFAAVLGRVRRSRREQEVRRLEEEVLMYERQFELIRQSQKSVRALKHDIRHHIKMLSDLIADGNGEEALAYLSSMGAFMETAEEYVSSGNEKIDSILNYMISRAKAGGAAVDWSVRIPETLPVPAFDINVVLSNLLENALYAIAGEESPVLSILLQYDRNVLYIKIKNTCAVKPDPGRDLGSQEEHGFGLSNVRRIAEKYHGSLEILETPGWFQASVLLFFP